MDPVAESTPSVPLSPDPPILQPQQNFYDEAAEQVSNLIDQELKAERIKRKEAKKKQVKVMLLGQAESGKSTLQKQFQLYYASQSLDHERPSWRPVVHFNVIKAVRMILHELDFEFTPRTESPFTATSTLEDEGTTEIARDETTAIQSEISHIRQKLYPLIAIEDSLASELNGGISVTGGRKGGVMSIPSSSLAATLAAKTLMATKAEIEELWDHPAVKALVRLRKLRLDDAALFFLDNIQRVAQPDYSPTIEDILNVRLQTLGVVEHSFDISHGGSHYSWIMYDVGGARGQRPAWMPYFDDATAIIFLAPISAFDEYLEEDLRTNRIDDSLQLFTMICSNKLLQRSHLILLLNKVDLLKKKLKAGIKVRKYITSYGNRPNNYEDVSEYFRGHFLSTHRKKDIGHRSLFVHFTSMLDIAATQRIIKTVGEAVVRSHISEMGLV